MLNNILYLSAYADLPNEIFIRQLYYWYIKVMNTDYIFKNKLIDEKNLLLDIVILSIAIMIFSFFCLSDFKIIYSDNQKEFEKIIGVNMKGMYTSLT